MADEAEKKFFTVTWKIQNVGLWLSEIKRAFLFSSRVSDSTETDNKWYMSLYGTHFTKTIEIGLYKTKLRDKNSSVSLQNSEIFLLKGSYSKTDYFKPEINCNPYFNGRVCFVIPEIEIFNNMDIYLTKDILTILCKIPSYKNRQCFIDTVLQNKVFQWDIESFSKSSVSTTKFQINLVNLTIRCTRLSHEEVGIDVLVNNNMSWSFIYCKIIQINTTREWVADELHLNGPKMFSIDTSHIINDTLSLKCVIILKKKENISYKNSEVASSSIIHQSQDSSPMAKILQDGIFQLYKNNMFCDATLRTGATSFSCHKNVLCAMSPVFCAIFQDHTLEGQTGVLDLPDLDPDTVKQMLALFYSSSLEDIKWDGASTLYYAADKYDILHLKKACRSILKAELSVSNACHGLVLADTHQDQDFMMYVEEFIARNVEVMYTSEWKDLEENNPKFLLRVLREIHLKSCVQNKGGYVKVRPKASNLIATKSDIEISLPNALQNGLLSLYNNKKFCDATLRTDNATFPVHRNVLCAVSPVFCALFEDETDVVDIPDLDPDTVKRMLLSVYGDTSEDLQWEDVFKLYYAVDMYDIQPLKEIYLCILRAKMSVANACRALVLAETLQDKDFLTYVQNFICNNDEVMNTVEWKDLEENHAKLVVKIMREIHFKNRKK